MLPRRIFEPKHEQSVPAEEGEDGADWKKDLDPDEREEFLGPMPEKDRKEADRLLMKEALFCQMQTPKEDFHRAEFAGENQQWRSLASDTPGRKGQGTSRKA